MSLPAATIEFAHRMFDAARNGDASVLVPAINAGLPPDLTNPEGNTLLMLAAYAGHHVLAKELLSRGADPNSLNDRGQSIVAGAVFKGYRDTVRVLVEAGADPRKGKPTAIEAAYMFGRKDLMEVLGAKDDDISEDVPRPVAGLS
ncbi:ankyrin [Armillaria luteobubalina]|uniref:Ankyrin n=1 Tax=Armillaria luteobubalina TaxID=153913 RepID=A0AA39PDR2_9AGAR|nr:ankyrin [Armillaria luteobubalina]KAK0481991.1 ankyrin [Armillaria luteobubalina]